MESPDQTKQAIIGSHQLEDPLNVPTPQAESFGHEVDKDVYRCVLCLRKFSSDLSLKRHEALSEMHRLNLENSTLIAKGRSRLANILRSTAN